MRMGISKYILTLALICPGLISCVNTGFELGSRTEGKSGVGYMTFRISTAEAGTKAQVNPGFEDGAKEEYALAADGNYHFALFYDADKDEVPAIIASASPRDNQPGDPDKTITESWVAVFSYSIDEIPDINLFFNGKECLVILNTDLSEEELKTKKKSEIKGSVTKGILEANGKMYFTMSNAAYVAGSTVKLASEINTDRIYSSREAALEAAKKGEVTLVANVERVVAKVKKPEFNMADGDYLVRGGDYGKIKLYSGLTGLPTYNYNDPVEQDWHAELLGYGINGFESSAFLFKNIRATEYFSGWNAPSYYRSYWAEDPHYAVDANTYEHYPQQYRPVIGKKTDPSVAGYEKIRHYHKGNGYDAFTEFNDSYYLRYVSFSSLIGGDRPQVFYPLENTYDDHTRNLLGENGYFTAGTHLLVACRLVIDGIAAGTDLYRDQNDLFYTAADNLLNAKLTILNEKALPGGNAGINILDTDWEGHQDNGKYLKVYSWPVGSRLYVDDNGWREAKSDDLTLIPAEIEGGDGQVLIAPKEGYRFAIRQLDGTESMTISYNELVSLFHKLMGAIDRFAGGYMYYPVPIWHNASSEESCKSDIVGSVGLVRNHAYKITVNSVSQPGRPVDEPDQPIIPTLAQKRDYIDASVKILRWHSIPSQDVPFSSLEETPKGNSN